MKESLPLFDDVQEAADTASPASRSVGDCLHDDLHLEAAQRLARRFKRSKVQARDRVRTGRLICRHLVAMLHDIDEDDDRGDSRKH